MNRIIKTTLVLAWGLIAGTGYGQERKTCLKFSGGPHYGKIQDRHAAPITYSARGPEFSLGLEHQGRRSFWDVELQGAPGQSRPDGFRSMGLNLHWEDDFEGKPVIARVGFEAPYYHAQLSANYLRKLSGPAKVHVWAGGGIVSSTYYTEISRYFWPLSVNGINLSGRAAFTLAQRHQLAGAVSLLAAGFLSRYNYASNPTLPERTLANAFVRENTRFVFAHTLQNVRTKLEYRFAMTRSISLGAGYELTWTATPDPRPLRMYKNSYHFQTLIRL